MNETFREKSTAIWSRLLGVWELMEEDADGPRTWVNKCGILSAYISVVPNGGYEFSLHTAEDEELPTIHLPTDDLDEAKRMACAHIIEFADIGSQTLSGNEIRIVQVTSFNAALFGVGVDGRLYEFKHTGWSPHVMTRW